MTSVTLTQSLLSLTVGIKITAVDADVLAGMVPKVTIDQLFPTRMQTGGHKGRRPVASRRIDRLSLNSIVYASGTFFSSSSIHTVASESLGARQSPRGDSEPPLPTLGPFGTADRLNWLNE